MAAPSQPSGLTDTDILIDAERGVSDAIAFLAAQNAAGGVQVSIISAMELVAGCRNATELGKVQQFMHRVTLWPVTISGSQTAYRWMESLCMSHGLLIPDSLIAATAAEHGLILYTKNVRHFRVIPGLTVVRPY
jgi:predicted nucleic acid-binding protein